MLRLPQFAPSSRLAVGHMPPRCKGRTALYSVAALGALLGVGLWCVDAVSSHGLEQGGSQVYTVAQVLRRVARDPHAWVGQVVNVEAQAVEMLTTTPPEVTLYDGRQLQLPDTNQTIHLGLVSSANGAPSPMLWARLRLEEDRLSRLRGTLRQWFPWLSRFIAPPHTLLWTSHDVTYRLRLLRVPTAPCHGADCDVAELDGSSLR